MLLGETHKFESHYPFKLLGGTPEEVPEVYKARSPVYHADQIKAPLLVRVSIIPGPHIVPGYLELQRDSNKPCICADLPRI